MLLTVVSLWGFACLYNVNVLLLSSFFCWLSEVFGYFLLEHCFFLFLFSLLLLYMFVLVLFVSICKVLILFVFMHVFFLTNSFFFLLIFPICFLFLFYFPAYQAIDEEAFSRQVFFPLVVMLVFFITICLYLQGFNFVCSYECFLLS